MKDKKKVNMPKKGLSRLFQLTKKKNSKMKISMVFGIVASIIKVLQVYFLYNIIKEIVLKNLDLSRVDYNLLLNYAMFIVICGLTYGLIKYVASIIAHKCAFEIVYDLKMQLVEHLSKIPIGYFTHLTMGKMDKIIMNDSEKIEGFIAHNQVDLAETVVIAPLIIIYLALVDLPFTLLSILPIIVAIALLAMYMNTPKNRADQVVLHNSMEKMQNEVLEYIEGMNEIKCYDLGERAMANYRNAIEMLEKIIIKIAKIFGNKIGIYYALLGASIFAIFPIFIYRYNITDNKLEIISKFILFVIWAPLLKDYIANLFTISESVMKLSESIKRIDEILAIKVLPEPQRSKNIEGYNISFENVDFSYDENGKKMVLKNIDFTAKQGEITAIIGSSGSGKTTIAKLILKFLVPTKGVVKIGDVDLREISSEELLKEVSFVFQESYLFRDTILFNLCMGRDIPFEKVVEVCKIVNLHDKISAFKEGYNTFVGKNEGFFSMGEIQRLSVARVILKDSKVIVLDEATAYADSENELNLQRAFQVLAKDKTVIIVAHRLKTIERAHQIIVVENAEIVESGRHEELLARKGRYCELIEMTHRSDLLSIKSEVIL